MLGTNVESVAKVNRNTLSMALGLVVTMRRYKAIEAWETGRLTRSW
jgi:hypothetical protein